jgi:hypothetical protein
MYKSTTDQGKATYLNSILDTVARDQDIARYDLIWLDKVKNNLQKLLMKWNLWWNRFFGRSGC